MKNIFIQVESFLCACFFIFILFQHIIEEFNQEKGGK